MPNETPNAQLISIDVIDDPVLAIRSNVDDESFDTLINSIRDLGVLQPILVKPVGERYEVIAGHRRLLAVRSIGLLTIPAIVCSVDPATSEVMKMHENFCREDVNIVDEAIFLETIMEKLGFTVAQLAEKIGRSESYVRTRLEMREWHKDVLDSVWRGDISQSAASWLNRIETDSVRADWLNIAIRGGITAAQAQHWFYQWQSGLLPDSPTDQIVADLGTGETTSVKTVVCTLCALDIPLVDAILLYGHKDCADFWKSQHRVNKERERTQETQ